MKKLFGKSSMRTILTSTIFLALMMLLLSSVMSVHATTVTFIKEHHPPSTFTDPSGTTDGYTPGANIRFHLHINVTQSTTPFGIVSITNLTLIDTLPTGLTYVPGSQLSDPAAVSFSAVGNVLTWNWSTTVLSTAVNPPEMPSNDIFQATTEFNATVDITVPDNTFLTNNAQASYNEVVTGALSQPTTTDTIWIARPVLDIIKQNPAKVENGSSFDYVLTLNNTGHLDAVGINVTDTLPSGVTHTPGTSTATSGTFAVDSGTQVIWTGTIGNVTGSHIITITIPVTASTADPSVLNIANYTAFPSYAQFTNSGASCITGVIHPGIKLYKTTNVPKIESGGTVTYNYTVVNIGDTHLTVALTDDVFGSIYTSLSLDAGATNTTLVNQTLTTTTVNNATATGVDQTGASVQSEATATVTVIHPAISLTKTPSPNTSQIAPANFTYTYNATNTGDTTLSGVTVFDQTFNVQITIGTNTLTPGQWTTGTFTETYASPGTYTDIANATGTDQTGAKVTAFANATVVVTAPPVQTTRTWGFWKTHTNFTEWVFTNRLSNFIAIDSGSIHAKNITTYPILFGAFEADVAKMSNGTKRTLIDSARISLLHQLLGAILNTAAFNTTVPIDPVTGLNLISAANIAYSGNNATEINRLAGLLDTFNGSGDNIAFPPGLPPQGNATPQDSIAIANVAFWDNL